MDIAISFLRTILDFLVQIVTLILQMFIYIFKFLIGLVNSIANSV